MCKFTQGKLHSPLSRCIYLPSHTMQTDRETVWEEGHRVPEMFFSFSLTDERNEEMRWEKRWRWIAASCCHTPAKRTERRAQSHRISQLQPHLPFESTPCCWERRGEERPRKKRTYPSFLPVCVGVGWSGEMVQKGRRRIRNELWR